VKVLDLTPPQRELRVRIDPSPAYDFIACLYMLANDESLEFDVPRKWIERARGALGADLRADLRLLFPPRGRSVALVGVLEDTPGLPVRAFIKKVAATAPDALVELMLEGTLADRQSLPLLRAALGGGERAVEAYLEATHAEIDRRALRALLAHFPAEIKAKLVRLLREGHARVYAPEEPRVIPLLERNVAALTRLAAVATGSQLVEHATGGFVIGPEAGWGGVVLAPTYFFRPYNLITACHGTRVFIYPMETSATRGEPPAEVVRLYKALGDETRLKILRLLASREMYLQELAKALGVTHVTALHHMAALRAAHLVQVVERDSLKYYRLRTDRARAAAAQWLELIHA
jgi:DNA-binding transcriptional ArsR family regulator